MVNDDSCTRAGARGSLFPDGAYGDSEDCSRKLGDDPSRLQEDLGQIRGALEMLQDLTAGRRDVRNEGDQPRPCESRWQPRLRDEDEEEDSHIQNQVAQNKWPRVMPDQFDGKTSWADYIAHFEICSEINGWNAQQRAQFLSVSLRESACQVMGTLPPGRRRDYREPVRALGRRFDPENQSELYRVQLRNRGRKPNETLPELGQQICTLVAQAYPRANAEILDVLGRDHFIDAIDDPDIRWRIYQAKPENLDGAICTAVEFEAYKAAEKQRVTNKRFIRDISSHPKNLTTRDAKEDESILAKLQRQITDLQKQLQASRAKENAGGKQQVQRSPVRCWNCGEAGHVQYNCPANQSN